MTKTVYVDTNIFLDFLEERHTKTFQFFMRTITCEFQLYISDIVLFEIKKYRADFTFFQNWLANKLIICKCTKEDKNQAKKMPTHYADALHASIAKRVKVDFFLSQDKGFRFLENHRKIDEI